MSLLHGHHEGLISWGREYGERLTQIRAIKPESEWATRERYMATMTEEMIADLPPEYARARAEFARARAEYDKALAEFARALVEFVKARAECGRAEYAKARAEYDKAGAEYAKARAECDKAGAEYAPELEAWHRRWCKPDCPATAANNWSIFGGAK